MERRVASLVLAAAVTVGCGVAVRPHIDDQVMVDENLPESPPPPTLSTPTDLNSPLTISIGESFSLRSRITEPRLFLDNVPEDRQIQAQSYLRMMHDTLEEYIDFSHSNHRTVLDNIYSASGVISNWRTTITLGSQSWDSELVEIDLDKPNIRLSISKGLGLRGASKDSKQIELALDRSGEISDKPESASEIMTVDDLRIYLRIFKVPPLWTRTEEERYLTPKGVWVLGQYYYYPDNTIARVFGHTGGALEFYQGVLR